MKRLLKILLVLMLALIVMPIGDVSAKKAVYYKYSNEYNKIDTFTITTKRLSVKGTLKRMKSKKSKKSIVDEYDWLYIYSGMIDYNSKKSLKQKYFSFKLAKKVTYIYANGEGAFKVSRKQFLKDYKSLADYKKPRLADYQPTVTFVTKNNAVEYVEIQKTV